jgi:hypothetical protein
MAKERKKIIDEFIESEGKYLDSLYILEELKKNLLSLGYVDQKQQELIFGDVTLLIGISEKIHQCLQESQTPIDLSSNFNVMGKMFLSPTNLQSSISSSPSTTMSTHKKLVGSSPDLRKPLPVSKRRQTFGEAFKSMVPSLGLYFPYISQQIIAANSVKILLDSNVALSKYLTQLRQTTSFMKGHEIRGLLIKPVQRPPRYQMLLETLLVNTPEYHYDWENISEALARVIKVNEGLNLKQSLSNTRKMLDSLQMRFPLISNESVRENSTERQFVKKGKLNVRSKQDENFTLHDVFLFTDLLLLDLAEESNESTPVFLKRESSTPKNSRDSFLPSVSRAGASDDIDLKFTGDQNTQIYLHTHLLSVERSGTNQLNVTNHLGLMLVLEEVDVGDRDVWFKKIHACIDSSKAKNMMLASIQKSHLEVEKKKQITKMNAEIKVILEKYQMVFSQLKIAEDKVENDLKSQLYGQNELYNHLFPKKVEKYVDETNFGILHQPIEATEEDIKNVQRTVSFFRPRNSSDPESSEGKSPGSPSQIAPKYKGGKIRRRTMQVEDEVRDPLDKTENKTNL